MSTRFAYIKYDETATAKSTTARELCEKVEHFLETQLPNSRYKSLALTALEEAYAWIGKAIRDEQVLERSNPTTKGDGDHD